MKTLHDSALGSHITSVLLPLSVADERWVDFRHNSDPREEQTEQKGGYPSFVLCRIAQRFFLKPRCQMSKGFKTEIKEPFRKYLVQNGAIKSEFTPARPSDHVPYLFSKYELFFVFLIDCHKQFVSACSELNLRPELNFIPPSSQYSTLPVRLPKYK